MLQNVVFGMVTRLRAGWYDQGSSEVMYLAEIILGHYLPSSPRSEVEGVRIPPVVTGKDVTTGV